MLLLHFQHDTKAGRIDLVVRRQMIACSTSASFRRRRPGAAAQDALGPLGGPGRIVLGAVLVVIGGVPVGAPFLDVAVHVEEPEVVARIIAAGAGSAVERAANFLAI